MHARDHAIEYYITNIQKVVCGPNLCPEQNYMNPEEVVHWTFSGDGTGDYEEHGNWALTPVVEQYIKTCEEQKALAEEYVRYRKEQDNEENDRDTALSDI